jgi:hypothetical protein
MRRETAIEPASIAHSGIWTELRRAREAGLPREEGWSDLLRFVETAAVPAAPRDLSPATEPQGPPARALRAVRRRLRPVRRRARKLVSKASGWAR